MADATCFLTMPEQLHVTNLPWHKGEGLFAYHSERFNSESIREQAHHPSAV